MTAAKKPKAASSAPATWGNVTDRILALLSEEGPMTRLAIEAELGYDKRTIASIMTRLTSVVKRGKGAGKRRVHIRTYVLEEDGSRRYPRPVYALGDRPDAVKPTTDDKATKRRYWARRTAKLRHASVFNLGAKVHDLMRRAPANDAVEQEAA